MCRNDFHNYLTPAHWCEHCTRDVYNYANLILIKCRNFHLMTLSMGAMIFNNIRVAAQEIMVVIIKNYNSLIILEICILNRF